jgi:hypothetical protein
MQASQIHVADKAAMTDQPSQLRGAIQEVAEIALDSSARQGLNETETRAHLIDPILDALGYRSLREIRREVRLPDSGHVVDYLLTAGSVRVVVEAKALRSGLGPRDASQLVGYCAMDGVRWALLTDGIHWEVFDVELPGNWQARRVARVDIEAEAGEGSGRAHDWLALFSKERLGVAEEDLIKRARTERAQSLLDELLTDPTSQAIQGLTRTLLTAGIEVKSHEVVALLQGRGAGPVDPPSPPRVQPPQPPPVQPLQPVHNYYLLPVAAQSGFKAIEFLQKWLPCGFWGVPKTAAHRQRLQRGDSCCFYVAARGIVATATIEGPADLEVSPEEWPGPNDYSDGVFKVPLSGVQWLSEPRKVDESVRGRLEVFRDRDPDGPWSWFIRTSRRVSKADFEVLIGSEGT